MPVMLLVAVAVAVLILVLVLVIASRPAEFRIQRTGEVGASPEVVHGLINDFHRWIAWSPWEHLDPNLQRTYTGPSSGTGAVYDWLGNKDAGQGRMTILDSKPGELVSIKLEFIKPFAVTNQCTFALSRSGAGTRVVWSMDGKNNFMMKGFSLFCNMDKMVGKDFERGLVGLDKAAREAAKR